MKILSYLKSRTVLAVIAMFVIGGLESVSSLLPPELRTAILGLIGAAAVYFRVRPKQKFEG